MWLSVELQLAELLPFDPRPADTVVHTFASAVIVPIAPEAVGSAQSEQVDPE